MAELLLPAALCTSSSWPGGLRICGAGWLHALGSNSSSIFSLVKHQELARFQGSGCGFLFFLSSVLLSESFGEFWALIEDAQTCTGCSPMQRGKCLWRSNGSSTPRAGNCSALGLRLFGSCVPSHCMAASSPTHPIRVRWDSGGHKAKPQRGGRQEGEKCHPQKQLNCLIKSVASRSARCSFPFALAQPHLHHGPIAGLPSGRV